MSHCATYRSKASSLPFTGCRVVPSLEVPENFGVQLSAVSVLAGHLSAGTGH